MEFRQIFLLLAAAGLTPIALSYGLVPATTLDYLYGIDATMINTAHIFRAIMGLYLALVLFWVLGALRPALTVPALWSLTVFMLGLAAGRVLSLTVDGMPHPLLVVYLLLELGFGAFGLALARQQPAMDQPAS